MAKTATGLLGWLRAYVDSPDPLARACNLTALIVAGNQPFYPLYVRYLVADDGGVAFLTMLSTPFFLAVPLVARFHSLAGRLLLMLTAIGNTIWSCKLFGTASGVELFLLPVVMIAAMALRPGERKCLYGVLALAFLTYAVLHSAYGSPLHAFTEEEYDNFLSLNAFSVAGITAFIALNFSGAMDEDARNRYGA